MTFIHTLLMVAAVTAVIILFVMPTVVAVPFAALCLWLMWRKKRAELVLLLASLAFVFGCLEVFTRVFVDDIFYREHERFALKRRYIPNVDAQVHARFGDLIAMDPSLKDALAIPRDIHFKTDSLGFRNAADYQSEPYVMLGDSFVATVGNTQEDSLISQANRAMPHLFYSLAFPGVPSSYEGKAIVFLDRLASTTRFLWFIYEGNDFSVAGTQEKLDAKPTTGGDWIYFATVRRLPLMASRVLAIFYRAVGARVNTVFFHIDPLAVPVFKVAGQSIGFFGGDMGQAPAAGLEFNTWGSDEIMHRTACVFFIPTKYRVYKPWIKDGPAVTEPAAGLVALHRYFDARHIPIVDLTPTLQTAAKEHLAKGEFIYWRDDTHWNAKGIKSVIPDIKRCIEQDKAKQHL